MSDPRDGLARSVQVRLARHARTIGVDPNLVLTRYAVERFLYRLSRSAHAERFVLKGALLMLVWLGETLRPTSDADLLGIGELSEESLARVLRDVAAQEVEPDAVDFIGDSVRVEPIRVEDDYGGWRATIQARVGAARLTVQVDIGIGDAVTPAPEWLEYPGLLDLPRPRLRAYPRESVAAEKLHAIVLFGARNSRMKDYFDLHALAREGAVDAAVLGEAIAATFTRRTTEVPNGVPLGLRDEFARDPSTEAQWKAFLARNRIQAPPLGAVVREIRDFSLEPMQLARIKTTQAG
ncbi:MAG: nucleotidyl transferase AbiEii/AbiGii toxin family protein [Candidatus Eisenbacteria bacterium]|nr:nucleotidyl transferase AbiEii/AbiGii toxin family protein [Candidatus Eisenbacteria bacterium]